MDQSPAEVTIICCIEAGALEPMTLRMVESLRHWGGWLTQSPVIAVTPRYGSGLAASTRRGLERLGVEYLWRPRANPWPWYHFLNKPAAAVAASERARTQAMLWLDSDTLLAADPVGLMLGEDEDLLARADAMLSEPYLRALCVAVGADFNALPLMNVADETDRMRLSINSGVIAWRRQTGFADKWLRGCVDVLEARVASTDRGVWYTEQVVIGPLAARMGLRFRELGRCDNYSVTRYLINHGQLEGLSDATVVHYHEMSWPENFATLLGVLRKHKPALYEWLAGQGPLRSPERLLRRPWGRALRLWRRQRLAAFERACRRL
jgi:hypothetical protein